MEFIFIKQPHRHCEPTGRANARPMTGSAKQSILSLRGEMDCFAALAMTTNNVGRYHDRVAAELH
jgi:hypothetical protein